MISIKSIVDAFAQGDLAGLATAAQQADDALRPTLTCLHEVVAYRRAAGVSTAALPGNLVAALDRALDAGPTDPDLRMALLGIAARHALASTAAAGRPVSERLAACAGLVERARRLVPHCRCLRSRAILARLDTSLGRLTADHSRCLRAVDAVLADPELVGDEDLRLEFILHRLHSRLNDHQLLGIDGDLATVIGDAERCRVRIGFDPMWLQDLYWYLTSDYERIFATTTGTGWQACRTRRDRIHTYALLSAGRLDEVEVFLRLQHDRLEREGAFARQHDNEAVSHHELQAALCLAQGRMDAARATLRRCNAAAEDPHGYLPLQLAQAAAIELADGNAGRARASLELLDPAGDRGDCLMAWCRLLLLEGDRLGAAQYFARAKGRTTPGYLEHQFRFAHELRAADVLWLSRQEPAATPVKPRSTPTIGKKRVALVGDSAAMARVRREIATFAPLDQMVLITGETGTGKECVAQLLHDQGAHPTAPFLPLNCAALPDALAESELFGHARGAFTGADRDAPGLIATAGEGTVFLDEIASLSPRLQGVLLRVLETGDYRPVGGRRMRRRRARVVVASNRPLAAVVSAGEFRADLYYRLARFTIDLPSLRERREDIPQLCRHFVALASGGAQLGLSEALLARLQRHDWPGNVRELRNEIERLVVLAPGGAQLDDDEVFAWGRSPSHARPDPVAELPCTAPQAAPSIPGVAAARQRRRAILALLQQRQRLSRAEVVAALGCAPSTATADLRALQRCGLIERIETSGHLRTSYFVLRSSGRDPTSAR